MITLKDPPRYKVYAAGITDRKKGQWIWQGTVVAENFKQASRLLGAFKRTEGIKGACHVLTPVENNFTQRPKGVSNSLDLF